MKVDVLEKDLLQLLELNYSYTESEVLAISLFGKSRYFGVLQYRLKWVRLGFIVWLVAGISIIISSNFYKLTQSYWPQIGLFVLFLIIVAWLFGKNDEWFNNGILKDARAYQTLPIACSVKIDKVGFETTTVSAYGTSKWHEFTHAYETKAHFLLYTHRLRAVAIPKSCLSGDYKIDSLRALIVRSGLSFEQRLAFGY